MGSIIGIKTTKDDKVIVEVQMEYEESLKLKGHITIDYFVQKLIPQKLHHLLTILINVIIMIFLIYVITSGYTYSLGQMIIAATAANIPKTYVYLSIPVGMTFVFFHIMVQTVEKIFNGK